ncbi:hypothetical protein PFICI_03903 [Pestalotiopsis fici W106-1]|uniref:Uncharacterized protein n=1 Tax=Pestalotiopsis fici (strain W106-1 / CGMCC3.15140) TaxID=1229662 RepID=W3XIH8_PESFW|nr:uncharacterized protein PFICI_03903 [Pestalotiopsis fici W106-1]ETS85878.1 hypothetical protein PFICI_03903 [Pestalotiopsis fici W106-1]
MDCDMCFSHNSIRSTIEQISTPSSVTDEFRTTSEETSSNTDRSSSPTEEACSTTEHSPKPIEKTSSTTEPVRVYLNKYGDVPNPARQIKAARRRRNQELRRTDPERYRREMAEKKILRDEKLRAERELRRCR